MSKKAKKQGRSCDFQTVPDASMCLCALSVTFLIKPHLSLLSLYMSAFRMAAFKLFLK